MHLEYPISPILKCYDILYCNLLEGIDDNGKKYDINELLVNGKTKEKQTNNYDE